MECWSGQHLAGDEKIRSAAALEELQDLVGLID